MILTNESCCRLERSSSSCLVLLDVVVVDVPLVAVVVEAPRKPPLAAVIDFKSQVDSMVLHLEVPRRALAPRVVVLPMPLLSAPVEAHPILHKEVLHPNLLRLRAKHPLIHKSRLNLRLLLPCCKATLHARINHATQTLCETSTCLQVSTGLTNW
jgi:hypothetical protein